MVTEKPIALRSGDKDGVHGTIVFRVATLGVPFTNGALQVLADGSCILVGTY
jgi:hypothetical protein